MTWMIFVSVWLYEERERRERERQRSEFPILSPRSIPGVNYSVFDVTAEDTFHLS